MREVTILSTDTVVHCESRIICQIVKGLQRNQTRAYGYIGISKLSCYVCQELMEAINKFHGMNLLMTKGCCYKWCYSWPFPRIDREVEIGTIMHDNAAATCDGFRRKEMISAVTTGMSKIQGREEGRLMSVAAFLGLYALPGLVTTRPLLTVKLIMVFSIRNGTMLMLLNVREAL